MSAPRNPFTPSFGTTPPALVGRQEDLQPIAEALEGGVGHPHRAVKVVGLRGSGKTVFLNAVEDEARERGWQVLSESARPGIADRLTRVVLPRLLEEADPEGARSRVTGAGGSIGGVGVTVDREIAARYHPDDDFRSLLSRLADLSTERGSGVLLTIDELNRDAAEDLRTITQAVQHCFREGREVALVAAGLQSEVQDLLSAAGVTFLRRAEEVKLEPIRDRDVRRGLLDPIQDWGKRITSEALDVAVEATKGYPYMIQAIGHQMWKLSGEREAIGIDEATQAGEYALRRVGDLVLAPELRPLSAIDRSYLAAMARDDGPSRTGEVAQRLGVTPSYGGVYRDRLLRAGIIAEAGRGRVDFTLGAMRDYLRSHSAAELLHDTILGSDGETRTAPENTPPPARNSAARLEPPDGALESSQRAHHRNSPPGRDSPGPGTPGR